MGKKGKNNHFELKILKKGPKSPPKDQNAPIDYLSQLGKKRNNNHPRLLFYTIIVLIEDFLPASSLSAGLDITIFCLWEQNLNLLQGILFAKTIHWEYCMQTIFSQRQLEITLTCKSTLNTNYVLAETQK